jgi:phosphoribosylglycinamide formyltransferase-1
MRKMIKKIKTAILISGRGSNLQALINAAKNDNFPAKIALVISNKADAYGLEIAKNYNIKTAVIDHKKFNSRVEFDKEMSKIITSRDCKIICLAGFMRLLSAEFINQWFDRIINIHPSLLPAFKGANAVMEAINYGVKYSGCTTHYVREEMDSGPIIKQAIVEILPGDNKETLAVRILKQEHIIYPQSLEIVCNKISSL